MEDGRDIGPFVLAIVLAILVWAMREVYHAVRDWLKRRRKGGKS